MMKKKTYETPTVNILPLLISTALMKDYGSLVFLDKDGNQQEWGKIEEGDLDEGEEIDAKQHFDGFYNVWEEEE